MLTATITAIVGIAIVILTIWWVTRGLPESEEEEIRKGKKRTQELMSTPEGRAWLAEKVGGTFRDLREGDRIDQVKACPTCEGYGKLGHVSKIIKGAKVESTSDEICKDCGGTGIEGGLDYENIQCPGCDGRGWIKTSENNTVGPKCNMCQGTKVVQRDKIEKGEK